MQTALIIGGSRGIGAAAVREMCARGWRTAFTYCRSEAAAEQLSRETGAAAIKSDAASEADAIRLHGTVMRDLRHVDALIYNAGTAWTGLTQEMRLEEWDGLFGVHVRGMFLHVRAFLPEMISQGSGSICLVSSMWGQVGASCETAYSACKAAVIGFTRALAKEVGPSGVRVNCVAPGVIKTDMLNAYSAADLQALADDTPLGRLGTPEDAARAIAFLSGPDAAFITGQVLGVNGGFVV